MYQFGCKYGGAAWYAWGHVAGEIVDDWHNVKREIFEELGIMEAPGCRYDLGGSVKGVIEGGTKTDGKELSAFLRQLLYSYYLIYYKRDNPSSNIEYSHFILACKQLEVSAKFVKLEDGGEFVKRMSGEYQLELVFGNSGVTRGHRSEFLDAFCPTPVPAE